jgi:YgiT-type zinc finger domain-containing protein
MKCLMCKQAELNSGLTTVILKRGELTLVLENVPVLVCPNCGESYATEAIAIKLLAATEKSDFDFSSQNIA